MLREVIKAVPFKDIIIYLKIHVLSKINNIQHISRKNIEMSIFAEYIK